LQDEHGSTEHEQGDQEDEEEVSDIVDGFCDQLDEERCGSEQLAPVQYFDPKQEG